MTTPYGVTGCRCAVDSDDGEARWAANPHCPYHGLLPRDRTDTGVYRVVRGDDGKPPMSMTPTDVYPEQPLRRRDGDREVTAAPKKSWLRRIMEHFNV